MKYLKRIIGVSICLCLCFAMITVQAASPFKITVQGKTVPYQDTVLKIMVNDKLADTKMTPGIIINGTGMVPYEDVFVKSSLNVKAAYYKNTKKLLLKNDSVKIEMQTGSNTAIVNGKKKKMPAAPVMVRYESVKKTVLLIPARFVAEELGYLYSWYQSSSTVKIDKKGMILNYDGKSYHYKGSAVSFAYNDKEIKTAVPGVILNGTTMAPANEIFKNKSLKTTYRYNKEEKKLTLKHGKNEVILYVGKKTAKVNNKTTLLPQPPKQMQINGKKTEYIMVPAEFIAEKLGFSYEFDSSGKCARISDAKNKKSQAVTVKLKKGQVKKSELKEQEDILTRSFVLTIPGDKLDYYKSNPVKGINNKVKIEVRLNKDQDTEIQFQTNTVSAFTVTETKDEFLVTVCPPREKYSKIIFLDAGHGGTDPGTLGEKYGNSLVEKEINLKIVHAVLDAWTKSKASDLKIYTARTEDAAILNAERANLANEIGADIYISIHTNANEKDSSVNGTEVVCSIKQNKQSPSGLTSEKLAANLLDFVVDAAGTNKRSLTKDNIEVLNSADMPSVLLETGFLSNEKDAGILGNPTKINQIGKGIYQAIENIFIKYPTKR